MQKRLLVVASLLVAGFAAHAQQQPQFSHYGFNGMYLSPGYAGITNRPEVTFLGRYQYLNYAADFGDAAGAPNTFLLTASVPVLALNGGIGAQVYRDKIGNTTVTNTALSYAYHIKLNSGKLGIGVQGIFNSIAQGDFRAKDANDPNVPIASNDKKLDAGAGIWYQGEKFYIGGGVNNLAASKYKFDSRNTLGVVQKESATLTAARHAYLSTGYNFELSPSFVLTPTAVGKLDFEGTGKTFSFEAGVRGTINDRFWLGAGYRHQDAVTGLAGVSFAKNNMLRLGYAFDLVVFNSDAKARTSHELMLGLRLAEIVPSLRPIIRTPRYSF